MIRDSNFFRKFNQNIPNNISRMIITFAVIIVIGIFLRIFAKNSKPTENSNLTNSNNQTIYTPKKVVTSDGKEIKENQYNEDESIIENFINYCKNEDINSAYNCLTDECKNILYPTVNDFKEQYYKNIFSKDKTYNIQSWINKYGFRTYKIRIIDDILATGNYEESDNYEDYITINTDNKININKYIGKKEINKITENDNIKINVLYKDIYLQNVVYTIKITNNTDKIVMLAPVDSQTKENVVLEDDNKIELKLIDDLKEFDLKIQANSTKELKLKLKKNFSSEYDDDTIKFKKVIKDYESYLNEEDYDDYFKITVNV